MSWTRIKPIFALVLLFGALLWIVDSPAPAAPPVKVEEAIPNVGEQGATNLMVKIKGRNFDNSAQARFLFPGGGPDAKITVNSTTFVNSRELDCDVTIEGDADIDFRDIEVELLNSGRKGKGTEAFRVVQSGGGGNELLMGVTMDDVLVIPGGGSGTAAIQVSFTNTSTRGGDPTTTQAVVWVWAERCSSAGFAGIDLDENHQPQYNCTREDYRSVELASDTGFPQAQTLTFSGLPSGGYIFFVDLNTNESSSFAWKHGFAVGSVQ